MRYLITKSTSGGAGEVEITRDEFETIRTAKRGVFFALGIEERFAMFRENYREYEREIFEIAQKEVLYAQFEWAEHVEDIYVINRRLLNLLSSARLCKDVMSNALHASFVPEEVRHKIRVTRADVSSGYWQFDFLEIIRNKIQHKLLPVSGGGRKSSIDLREDGSRMLRHTADPQISLKALVEAKHISAPLLERVKPHAVRGDLIMLNPVVREYVMVMGKVHKAVRVQLEDLITAWDTTYLGAIERGVEATGSRFALSLACEYEEADDELNMDKPPNNEDLFDDLVKRRKYLEGRGSRAHMMPTAKDFISTE
jgi:hypothetical protein